LRTEAEAIDFLRAEALDFLWAEALDFLWAEALDFLWAEALEAHKKRLNNVQPFYFWEASGDRTHDLRYHKPSL